MTSFPSSIRERRVFFDTGAYAALIDTSDENHIIASVIYRQIANGRLRPFTTNAVLIESHAFLLAALGIRAAGQFLRDIDSSNTVVVRCRAADEARAKEIIFQYDDKDFSFTDALSFAVMERLGISIAFAFDRHFSQYGVSVLT